MYYTGRESVVLITIQFYLLATLVIINLHEASWLKIVEDERGGGGVGSKLRGMVKEIQIHNVISNIEDFTVSVVNTSIGDHYVQETVIMGFGPEREPAIVRTIRETNTNNINILIFNLPKKIGGFSNENTSEETKFEAFNKTFNFYLDTCCSIK